MNLLKFLLAIVVLTFVVASPVFAEVGQLSNVELKQLIDKKIPIIDIRRQEEWKSTGVIEGSHKLTFFDARGNYNLNKWLSDLDKIAGKDEPFILICRSGNRTGQVSAFLDKKLGYKQVSHLKNGIKKWIKAGDKVVRVN